jgi:hypothetical protein
MRFDVVLHGQSLICRRKFFGQAPLRSPKLTATLQE